MSVGTYSVGYPHYEPRPHLSDDAKARLTTWLVDQRSQGVDVPIITDLIIADAERRDPLPPHERAYRLLRLFVKETKAIGQAIDVKDTESAISARVLAWSESTTIYEIDYLLDYMKQRGWIEAIGKYVFKVTVVGYSRIEERQTNIDSSQAFIAMWFHPSMDVAYSDGIERAIRETGYNPMRIDNKEHANKIEDEIIAEIRRSGFLVADFTSGPDGVRGSVYYEAGFAHGLGLQVIPTCRQDTVKNLSFDIAHYNHIVWSDAQDLCDKLSKRILALLGEGPGISSQQGGA